MVARGRYCPFGLGLLRFVYGWNMKATHGLLSVHCALVSSRTRGLYIIQYFMGKRGISWYYDPQWASARLHHAGFYRAYCNFPTLIDSCCSCSEKQKAAVLIFRPWFVVLVKEKSNVFIYFPKLFIVFSRNYRETNTNNYNLTLFILSGVWTEFCLLVEVRHRYNY